MQKKLVVLFNGRFYRPEFLTYPNGRAAICLNNSRGEEAYTATTNIPEMDLLPGETFVKDYSENEGMLNALTQANIVKDTGKRVGIGFVSAPVVTVSSCAIIAQFEHRNGHLVMDQPLKEFLWKVSAEALKHKDTTAIDAGTSVNGAGIEIQVLFPRKRTPTALTIIRAPFQGNIGSQRALWPCLEYINREYPDLKAKWNDGHMD